MTAPPSRGAGGRLRAAQEMLVVLNRSLCGRRVLRDGFLLRQSQSGDYDMFLRNPGQQKFELHGRARTLTHSARLLSQTEACRGTCLVHVEPARQLAERVPLSTTPATAHLPPNSGFDVAETGAIG